MQKIVLHGMLIYNIFIIKTSPSPESFLNLNNLYIILFFYKFLQSTQTIWTKFYLMLVKST